MYSCFKCSREFKRSDYLKKHIERKFSCNPLVVVCDPKTIPNNPKQSQIIPNNPKSNNSVSKSNFKCKYCKKLYKSNNGLYKHINEIRCKEIPNKILKMLIMNKKNKIIKKKIENNKQLLTLSQNNSNTSNTSNTSNNLNTSNTSNTSNNSTIKPVEEETVNFLTKKETIKLMNKYYIDIQNLIEKLSKDKLKEYISKK